MAASIAGLIFISFASVIPKTIIMAAVGMVPGPSAERMVDKKVHDDRYQVGATPGERHDLLRKQSQGSIDLRQSEKIGHAQKHEE